MSVRCGGSVPRAEPPPEGVLVQTWWDGRVRYRFERAFKHGSTAIDLRDIDAIIRFSTHSKSP